MNHFIELNALKIKDKLPGATAAYLQTQHFTVAYTTLKAGAEIPLHNHVQEAVDIIMEGELEMQIGDAVNILKPGMMSFFPPMFFTRQGHLQIVRPLRYCILKEKCKNAPVIISKNNLIN